MSTTVTIQFNDDSLEGIPTEVWERFKTQAKAEFPQAGDDAWAHWLSEAILAVGGGTSEVKTYFMTDVPINIAKTLDDILSHADWTWERLHAYILQAASRPGHLRIINFTESPQNFGTFIATGIRPEAFGKLKANTGFTIENFLAVIFDGLAKGHEIKLIEPYTIPEQYDPKKQQN